MEKQPKEAVKLELKELKPDFPQVYKKVACPSCCESVPAENMNINDKIAKCNNCHVVFPFQGLIAEFNKYEVRQEEIRPEGIDLFHFQDELEICLKQTPNNFDPFLLFIPLLGIFLGMAYLVSGKLLWPTLLFVIGSFYTIYHFLSLSKHKIYIDVNEQQLTIKWRPKKFHQDKIFARHDIDQLYIKKIGGDYYSINIITNGVNGQKHVPIITMLKGRAKAKYLEQEIEKHLGIQDRRVPEETA